MNKKNCHEIFELMDKLLEWSQDTSELAFCIENRHFRDYVEWKIPFPAKYIDIRGKNAGVRIFCVDRLLGRLVNLTKFVKKNGVSEKFCRAYCIITDPNLFGSEVGLVFSQEKWNFMLFRDVNTGTFFEKTRKESRSFEKEFCISMPDKFSSMALSHKIRDDEEGICFQGNIYVIWKDLGI